jgi:hypothetical protein
MSGLRTLSRRGSPSPDAAAAVVGLAGLTLVGWFLVFAKTGSALDLSIADYVARSRSLPTVLIAGDATADYRNWSMLPLVLGRLAMARTQATFATVQFLAMVVGSTAIVAWTARRRPDVALLAVLALFATTVPAYAMYFMGSYDQLLLVVLLGVAVADSRRAAVVLGAVVGVTHAEVGVIALAGLLALSIVRVGPPVRIRAWALAGVVAGRLALTIWLAVAGQSSSRLTFVEEYGLDRLVGYFADTWPVVALTAAGGGWVIVVAALAERRSWRIAAVVIAVVAVNLAVAAITLDQSRVVMLTTLPLVVTLAAFPPSRRRDRPWWAVGAPYAAAGAGLAMPLIVSWVGRTWRFGESFHHGW